jgi:hypothetical protein
MEGRALAALGAALMAWRTAWLSIIDEKGAAASRSLPRSSRPMKLTHHQIPADRPGRTIPVIPE